MKSFLKISIAVFILLIVQSMYSQGKITTDDLNSITGKWKGTLTYIDYGTNRPFTMPANLSVVPGKNEYQLKLLITYPKEPNANSKDKIGISKDGLFVNKNRVASRQELDNEKVIITTEYSGKDNRKNALIRNVYIFGSKRFVIRKEVKLKASADWLIRNEYNFTR